MCEYSHHFKIGIHHLSILGSNDIFRLEHGLQAMKADDVRFLFENAKLIKECEYAI